MSLPLFIFACSAYKSEPGEEYPGGDTTNTFLFGSNAFILPAENIEIEHEPSFYSGNSFFNLPWVEHPASTENRDGLGPLYNARSCAACHFKDGRAEPPLENDFLGLLLRIGIEQNDQLLPHPIYGTQLQNFSVSNTLTEGTPNVEYEEVSGEFGDGEVFTLLTPTYSITNANYGILDSNTVISPRIAPAMIGLGLLEAISIEDIQYYADPLDLDEDGISGQINWILEPYETNPKIGRFGWKSEKSTVANQVAAAFLGDIGITNPLLEYNNCTEFQEQCLEEPQEESLEIRQELFDKVVLYSSLLAVPMRRNWTDKTVLQGKRLFNDIGCSSCHIPSYMTSEQTELPEVSSQLIWPYTDLLLHDMGPGLEDQNSIRHALRREWKTPPLWGIGLIKSVNGHTRFLHDGRARSLTEAILWHGGEAEMSKENFRLLESEQRDSVIQFLESL